MCVGPDNGATVTYSPCVGYARLSAHCLLSII